MTWLDRPFERLFAKPAPFDCAWCSPDGEHGRHELCTGRAVRPYRDGTLRPAAVTDCLCALRQHRHAPQANQPAETRFPSLDGVWAVPVTPPVALARDDGAVAEAADPYRHVLLPPIDTPEERRHRFERRRRVNAVKSALPAAGILIALAIAAQCNGSERGTARPGPGTAVAEPAAWAVDPARPPQRDARSFNALVSRAACGEDGEVLAAQVIANDVSVTVIFKVASSSSGETGPCAASAPVAYAVPLGAPLGDRALFDGSCDLPPMSSTAACATAKRWPL